MENIMDKMEHFVARRFHLIMIAALVITMIASIAGIFAEEKQAQPITDGSWHCPNCGTVMYLEGKEV